MNNKEFSELLEERTLQFAVDVIRLSSSIANSFESQVIKNQITKSCSSIGANYREANRSRSRADFINKIKICVGEANETIFWLRIIDKLAWINPQKINPAVKEAHELLAIFTSISSKLKQK